MPAPHLVFNKGLDAFFHSLIPAELQEKLNTNTIAYTRTRALSAMLVVLTLLSLISNVIIGGMHALFQPELLKHDLVSVAILGFLVAQTWLFYRFNNYWMSSLAFTNFYFLLAAVMIILSGGYSSAGKPFLLTCPLVSFLVGGRQEGIQNSIALAVLCAALAALHLMDFELPNIFAAEQAFLIFSVNWAVSLAVICTTLIVYEIELQKHEYHANPGQTQQAGIVVRGFYRFREKIVPAVLHHQLRQHGIDSIRLQILVLFLVLGTTASVMAIVALGLTHLVEPVSVQNDLAIFGISAGFFLLTLLFYRLEKHELPAMLMGYFYSIMIVTVIVAGGGMDSPFMVLLMTCPMVVFMLRGIYGGLINTFLVFLIGLLLSYFEHIDYQLKNWFVASGAATDAEMSMLFIVAWTIAAAGVAVCMSIYDLELERPDARD